MICGRSLAQRLSGWWFYVPRVDVAILYTRRIPTLYGEILQRLQRLQWLPVPIDPLSHRERFVSGVSPGPNGLHIRQVKRDLLLGFLPPLGLIRDEVLVRLWPGRESQGCRRQLKLHESLREVQRDRRSLGRCC